MSHSDLQWSLFRVDLDPVVGSEQAGTRPVLVVSRETVNRLLPIVCVVPLTVRKPGRRVYSTEVLLPAGAAGQPEESIAMAHQLRVISSRRLGQRYGTLSDQGLRFGLREALRLFLDLE